jgi:hypothetical protein
LEAIPLKPSPVCRAVSYSAYQQSKHSLATHSTHAAQQQEPSPPSPPSGYMNYWTGEVSTDFPKEAATSPLLHTARRIVSSRSFKDMDSE